MKPKQKVKYVAKNTKQEQPKLKYQPKPNYQPEPKQQQKYYGQNSKRYQPKQPIHSYKEKPQNTKNINPNRSIRIDDQKHYVNYQSKDIQPISTRIDESDSRKLKKQLRACYPNADRIILKYSTYKPIIFFEYLLNQQTKLLHIRDLLNGNDNFKKENKLINRIYSDIYDTVNQKYFYIGVFGAHQAKEKRIRFNNREFFGEIKNFSKKNYQFYYIHRDSNQVNFVLFDNHMNTIQFGTKVIEDLKRKYAREYKLYQRFFESQIKPKLPKQELKEQYTMAEQVDSDQEDRKIRINNRRQPPNYQILERIQKIVGKDLTSYEEDIREKDEEVIKLYEQNNNDEAAKIADEIMELNENLQNFKTIRDDVEKRLKQDGNNNNILKPCLKRLIIGEKQLMSALPIISRKRQIFENLRKNDLLILQGETGSGKSTQLPQMLCEYYQIFHNEKAKPVLITQPRKLATRTLAERVASQMQEQVHGFVDYQASAHITVNPNAKIVFKMDRLVLDELRIDEILSNYCCLVIDEAHERTISIDVLLGLIKNLLQKRKDFKVIVTSASMDTELFKKYFNTKILKVSGRMYPVQQIYKPYSNQPDILKKIERLFDQELTNNGNLRPQYKGHILTFCSGLDQIEKICKILQKKLNPRVFKVLPLHGRLSPQEQKQVFNQCKQFKVIFATRIAETSITIDGIKVVIDPGQDIQQHYNQKTKITSMKLSQISQSSAKQRAGRAGRTNKGFCFRLYTKEYKQKLQINKIPEIKNMALDTLVLRLKSLEIDDVLNFPYLSPPDKEALQIAIQTVKMLGCIDQKTQKITGIGEFLVKIPIEPFLARSIIQAYICKKCLDKSIDMKMSQIQQFNLSNMDIVEEVIGILCMVINASNLFFIRFQDRQKAQKLKFQKLSNQSGDFNFFQKIIRKYLQFGKQRKFKERDHWLMDHFLSRKTMKQVQDIYKQIMATINKINFNDKNMQETMAFSKAKLKNCVTASDVLLSCLITSFSTNLCLYSNNEHIGYTLISQEMPIQIYGTSILTIQGINPKWIVCFDLYQNQMGQTYCKVAHDVSYQFLRQHVNPYVMNKYNISKAQTCNPYYQCIKQQVSTLVLLKIKQTYRVRESSENSLLKKFNMIFYDDRNEIYCFYNTKDFKTNEPKKESSTFNYARIFANRLFTPEIKLKVQTDPNIIIQNFFASVEREFNKFYHHNFAGPIYIHLKDGFELVDIDFKMSQTRFKVYVTGQAAQMVEQNCSMYGQMERFKDRLDFYLTEEENKTIFKEYLAYLAQFFQYKNKNVKFEEQIVDRRQKIPQAKLYLRFWAGQSERGNILVQFDRSVNIQEYLHRLKQGIRSQIKNHQISIFSKARIDLTKKGDSINIYPKMGAQFDQIDVHNQIRLMEERGYLGYGFQMPKSIKKFRDPDLTIAAKTDLEWHNDIEKKMKLIGIDDKRCAIRIWGYYDKSKKDGPKAGIQTTYRVDLHAEIKSFQLIQLKKFQTKYDNKFGIIGTEKVHATFQFEQMAAVTTFKVYDALQDELKYIKMGLKAEFPKITIDHFQKVLKNITKVFIKVRGTDRNQLLRPARIISKLFTPKMISIDPSKFRFLDKFDEGSDILDDIERKYDYKVYFGFERKSSNIKLYCEDRLQKQIHNLLTQGLQKCKYYEEEISYRGKNLHKIIEILKQMKENIKTENNRSKFMNYDILYKFRKVRITADLGTFDKSKNYILQLVNLQKGECDICSDLMQRPYRLKNCKHSFCWQCLLSYIKEDINQSARDFLGCPGCQQKININDVKTILSIEQFNKICDIQVSRFVEKHPDYHGCFSPNCENIFLTIQSNKAQAFQCDLCGKWYCIKCKQSHQNMSCEDWKSVSNQASLKQLGIKKCPKCGEGIQKNAGCQHMECIKCRSHICWNCMAYFPDAQKCYGHLQKQHGSFM